MPDPDLVPVDHNPFEPYTLQPAGAQTSNYVVFNDSEVKAGIRAFHGSPYDFNQFDLSKIGTGEGAQAMVDFYTLSLTIAAAIVLAGGVYALFWMAAN